MERILISLPSDLLKSIEEEAVERGLSRTAFIRMVLLVFMAQHTSYGRDWNVFR